MISDISQLDLTDMYKHHPTIAEYPFFSRVHGAFSEIDQVLNHKTNLNKFNKIEIMQTIFSNQNKKSIPEVKQKIYKNVKINSYKQPMVLKKKKKKEKHHKQGFSDGSVVKNLPANAGDMGWIPDSGRSHTL